MLKRTRECGDGGNLRSKGVSALKAAAVYIGTVVGAGFATGQEILQFFTRFGVFGWGGLFITTILFIIFGYIIMDLGRDLNAQSHLEIIRYSGGNVVGTVVDAVIILFLFGGLVTMIAGTGALFEQQLRLPALAGNVIMAVITAITVMSGITGVINSISVVVPFLLTAVFGISVFSLIRYPASLSEAAAIPATGGLAGNWLLSAVLYVSYNTVTSVAVLGPLGVETRDRKSVWKGAFLGGLGLGLGSFMINAAMLGHIAEIGALEVPMLYIAGKISPFVQLIYAIVLIAEVYTTAVGSLYGFTSRIAEMRKMRGDSRLLIICVTACALFASRIGFTNLVKYLYPLVGYGGVALLAALVISVFKPKRSDARNFFF